jgi:thiamine transport system substrate-binding protein
MPLNMFVYPVNPNAAQPKVFTQHAQIASAPAVMPYADIAKNRDAWIEAWMEAMK